MPPHSWCAPEANTAVQLNYGGIFENGLAAGAAIHWLSPEDPVTFPPGKCKICALCSPGSPVIIQTNPTTLLRRSIWIIVPNAAVFVNAERGNFAMKKISVLGDSISTFSGYTTPDGVFYDLFAMAMAAWKTPGGCGSSGGWTACWTSTIPFPAPQYRIVTGTLPPAPPQLSPTAFTAPRTI